MGVGGTAHSSQRSSAGSYPRTTDVRAVLDAIIDLLRTGCQWRQLPNDLPPWPTVHGCFRGWRMSGVWALLHRALYPLARLAAGRKPHPTVVIMDGQSVKTAEQGGGRGFNGHKRVNGRKRHVLVDILGLPIANRVEPANMSDRRAGGRLLAECSRCSGRPFALSLLMLAHESRKLARQLRGDGWTLKIVKRKQRAFKVVTWIVERSLAWLERFQAECT